MPYIGHAPTNAGQFVLLDDIETAGSPGGTFNGILDTFNMKVSSVSVSPSADNLLIMLSGIVQETPGSYTVSGSTIVFDDAPETGMTFYGILMGQSASVGAGTVNEASLEISNAGSNGQYLQKQSANTGGLTWETVTDTNTMGSGFTVSATTDSNATTITQGDDLMFTAGTGITCETTADGTVTITNTVTNTNDDVSVANLQTALASLDGDDTTYVGDSGDDTTFVIRGTLQVDGTTTTINTATVEVEDNILQLNTTQASPDTATATTSGITVYRGDGVTQASLIFDDADDTWDLTNNLKVAGSVQSGDLILKSPTNKGHYTIWEEEEYLAIKNENTGKKYKFVLEEIDE